MWHIIDILLYVVIGAYNFFVFTTDVDIDDLPEDLPPEDQKTLQILKTFSIFICFFMSMRSFSYFRIFKPMSNIVGIISIIIRKLWVFMLILLYFYYTMVCIDMIYRFGGVEDSFFYEVYVWTILGGAESEHFDYYPNVNAVIIIGTIFITIILLNILIAYLSNVFSRLEERQNINLVKEKSSMILDLEVIFYFFKFVIRGKKMKNIFFQTFQDDDHEILARTSFDDIKVGKP